MIQAAGFVRPYGSFQAQPFHLFLEKGLQTLGPFVRAAATRIVFRPLIHTDEDVMFECRH